MDEVSCLVDGCVQPQKATGLCGMHYARKRKHGTTDDRPKSYVRQPREKQCVDCGADFETTGHNTKRCEACQLVAKRRWRQEYGDRNRDELNRRTREQRAANRDAANARAKELRKQFPERQREYQRRYQDKHRDKISLKKRAQVFGIPVTMLLTMLDFQEYRCAICLRPVTITGASRFDVDHCHDTGEIRGILCAPCNRGIGMLRDDPVLCEIAAVYLRTSDKYQSLASGA